MAPQIRKSDLMKKGDKFVVRAGEYAGKVATIVNPTPFPDSDADRRRRITVKIGGKRVYLLPRLLEDDGRWAEAQQRPVATATAPPVTRVSLEQLASSLDAEGKEGVWVFVGIFKPEGEAKAEVEALLDGSSPLLVLAGGKEDPPAPAPRKRRAGAA